MRRPFWLPALNYYVLTAAVVLTFFFLIWGILHDGGDESPWLTAGVGACIALLGAVFLREIVLRRERNRYMLIEKSFDRQLNDFYSRLGSERVPEKLTIELNSAMIQEIKTKSDAAKVLGKFAAGHREVFELCGEYLHRNERELRLIGIGSPRLGPLRKGKESVSRYHKYHMLQWAKIEARGLTHEAKSRVKISEKIEAAQQAIDVIDTALRYYPTEHSLLESRELINEIIDTIKVSRWVEKAERAVFKGDYKQARSSYRDALFYLGRDDVGNEDREIAAARINAELEKINHLDDAGAEPNWKDDRKKIN
jgi:tetratricopeptide (TPR) repeat protein